MYTERKARPEIKSAAQGLFTFATYGLGMVIGTSFSGFMVDFFANGALHHLWTYIWLIPAAIALVVLFVFTFLFNEKSDLNKN